MSRNQFDQSWMPGMSLADDANPPENQINRREVALPPWLVRVQEQLDQHERARRNSNDSSSNPAVIGGASPEPAEPDSADDPPDRKRWRPEGVHEQPSWQDGVGESDNDSESESESVSEGRWQQWQRESQALIREAFGGAERESDVSAVLSPLGTPRLLRDDPEERQAHQDRLLQELNAEMGFLSPGDSPGQRFGSASLAVGGGIGLFGSSRGVSVSGSSDEDDRNDATVSLGVSSMIS